jgi:hypothetical protein
MKNIKSIEKEKEREIVGEREKEGNIIITLETVHGMIIII